jgi:hypothetical protein
VPAVVAKLAPNGAFPFPVVAAQSVGMDGSHLVNTQWKDFGPRAGMALDLSSSGRTVLRGGYGIFYTRYPMQYLQQTAFVNPPFAGVFNYSQSLTASGPQLTIANPYNEEGNPCKAPGLQGSQYQQIESALQKIQSGMVFHIPECCRVSTTRNAHNWPTAVVAKGE